jgi:hypothetical protein
MFAGERGAVELIALGVTRRATCGGEPLGPAAISGVTAANKGLEDVFAIEGGILAGIVGEFAGLTGMVVDVVADVSLAGAAVEATLAIAVVDLAGNVVEVAELVMPVSLLDEGVLVNLVVDVAGPEGDDVTFDGREAAPAAAAFVFVGNTGFITSTSFLSFFCFWTFSLS